MIITNTTVAKVELLDAFDLLRSQIASGENAGTTLEHIIGILFSDIGYCDETVSVDTDVIKRGSEEQRENAGHLILTLKPGAIVRIGYGDSLVDLELVAIKGSRVKVAFTAAKSVPIMRVASVKECRHGNPLAECNE